MDLGYEPTIPAGDSFAVCIRVPPCPNTGTNRNEMSGISGSGQGRFFKYYQLERLGSADYGWWCRPDYDMYMWVVMRPAGNPPLLSLSRLTSVMDTLAQTVWLRTYRCDMFADTTLSDSGITGAYLRYRVNDGQWNTSPMTHFNVGIWYGQIPGVPAGGTISYDAAAIFSDSTFLSTPTYNYRAVNLNRDGYITTFPPYNFIDIVSTGTPIPPTDFFTDGNYDDGTAGPFSLGGTFRFFDQNVAYAWVGANGALGLSASATDTVNLSSNGFFSAWDIPSTSVPPNFVGAFWNDLYLGPDGNGTVYYEAIGNRFIIEFYRVGNFNSATDTTTTFEFIVDRSDSSVTFQYADVGVSGLDFSALVGLQGVTPDHGWLFLNRFGYPDTTRPRNGLAIRMKYMGVLSVPGKQGVPEAFALYPNYPNPFNPSTVIRYSLPVGQNGILSYHVSLKVYNVLGQEVAMLANEVEQPGTYTVTWDAIGLSSGVYFCRLQAGTFTDTRKLLLIK